MKLIPDPSRHLGGVLWPSLSPWLSPISVGPGTDFRAYLDRKALLSRPLMANLAFEPSIGHPTPSVFHADQRGMFGFLIRTLGLEF